MMKKRKEKNGSYIMGVLSLALFFVLVLPSIGSADSTPSRCEVGIAWITEYKYWMDLPLCDDDAEGFKCALVANLPNWYTGFDKNEGDVHDEQWEIWQDQYFVDDVHFAYYAGHGYVRSSDKKTWLVFHDNILGWIVDSANIYKPDYCDWGDENGRKLNWVGLACCQVGQKSHYALDGVHMICGWRTSCTDAAYGPTLANKLISGKTVKQAWFETGDLHAEPGLTMNVKAEDISVANDHIYYCGTVYPDPPVDSIFYEWTETT